MSEIQLPSKLTSIATRINSHKNNIGYSFIEIGKELIKAKKEEIQHGEWQLFLDEINMSRTQAQRHITVTEQYNMGKLPDVGTIGLNAMYEIATLPEEEREKEHTLSSGETKTVDEMTVRELQETKRKLKQAEQQTEIERKERERLEKENEELANQEPERIEVVPDDYDYIKGNYESAISLRDRYKEQLEEMREELESSRKRQELDHTELDRLKQKEENLKNKIDSYEKLFDIQTNLDMILTTIQPKMHKLKIGEIKNEFGIVDEVESTLDEVIRVCNELRDRLPNKIIIEGEIVND